MITVYISFSELPSWLGLAPLKSLVDATGVPLAWKPMLSSLGNVAGSNLKPGEDDPLAEYKARRADARHKAARREQERACETLGISIENAVRKFDPLYLSIGLNWLTFQAAGTHHFLNYVESAFQAAYGTGADVESLDALNAILTKSGVSTDGLEAFVERDRATIEATTEQNLENGIFNAPAFVIDGEIFHGREHLPLIGWMLTGKQGIPPV